MQCVAGTRLAGWKTSAWPRAPSQHWTGTSSFALFLIYFGQCQQRSSSLGFHSFSFACLSIHPFLYSISEVGVDRVRRWVGGLSCVDALCSGGHGILCSFIVDDGSFLHLQHRFVACFFILYFFKEAVNRTLQSP